MIDRAVQLDPLLCGAAILAEAAEVLCELAFAPDVSLLVHFAEQFVQIERFRIYSDGLYTSLDELILERLDILFRQLRLLVEVLPQLGA